MPARKPVAPLRALTLAIAVALAQPIVPAAAQAPSTQGARTVVSGVVTDRAGQPMAGASVVARTADGTVAANVTTDAQGRYRYEIAPGSYQVAAQVVGQPGAVVRALEVGSSATTADYTLALGEPPAADEPIAVAEDPVDATVATPGGADVPTDDAEELEGVTVEGQYREGGQALYTDEKRASSAVTETLGGEQIARTGDSDVAQTLKRVTGLTLVDNKFVYVRGLGERYSAVSLNGAQIPSPDPTRRVVPLDLFPNDILDGIIILKSFTPNVPAEFSGGAVQLRTRGNPGRFYAKLGGSLGYADGTSFEDGLTYEGGDRDWTGFDDDTRELPGSIRDAISGGRTLRPQSLVNPDGLTPEQFEQAGEDLAGVYRIEEESLGPNGSLTGALGNEFAFDGWSLGVLGAVRYAHGWDSTEEDRRIFGFVQGVGIEPQQEVEREQTERAVDLSVYAALEARIGEGHRFESTTMLLRQTTDQAQIDEGYFDGDASETSRFFELEWEENELLVQQFSGEHDFADLNYLGINWQYTHAEASREAPNTRRYRYDLLDDVFQFSTRSNSNQTVFAELEDTSDELTVDFELPISINDDTTLTLTGGVGRLDRERDSEIRRFQFLPVGPLASDQALRRRPFLDQILVPENIGANGFQLAEVTRGTDNYSAEQTVDALFLNADAALGLKWRATLGARLEDNELETVTTEIGVANPSQIVSRLDDRDVLPAASVTYFADDNSQWRLAYSESLTRPDFRELAPAPFTDPVLDLETIGNPELQQTDIRNVDLRYEYYFSEEESISAALFWKDLDRPIEKVFVPGTGNVLSFSNADTARIYGLEIDLFKTLGFLGERFGEGVDWERFYVAANYARIESEVEIGDIATIQTTDNRPLQGSSPYVVNLQFGYKTADETHEATLLFNRFGERISQVGISGSPDVYEQPFNQMDLVWSWRFAPEWRVRVRLGNLLDDEVEFLQGDGVFRSYRKGRDLALSLEWRPGS